MNVTTISSCILLVISLNTYAAKMSDPLDLEHFEETNSCQSCDISDATIYENHDNGTLLDSFAIRTKFNNNFYNGNFSGSIMTYCEIDGFSTRKFQKSVFNKTNLSYSKLNNVDLSNADFTDANLSFADFTNANLSRANFTNTNLENATFYYSILIGSNLTEEQLQQVKSIDCTIMPDGNLSNCKN